MSNTSKNAKDSATEIEEALKWYLNTKGVTFTFSPHKMIKRNPSMFPDYDVTATQNGIRITFAELIGLIQSELLTLNIQYSSLRLRNALYRFIWNNYLVEHKSKDDISGKVRVDIRVPQGRPRLDGTLKSVILRLDAE